MKPFIEPHKIKHEPGTTHKNDNGKFQWSTAGSKTDVKDQTKIKLELCKDTDHVQTSFSPPIARDTMSPQPTSVKFHKMETEVNSKEENNPKIPNSSNVVASLIMVPQSGGNLILKSAPTYYSRPYLREIIKFEPTLLQEKESPPSSPHINLHRDLKLESSTDDLKLTANQELQTKSSFDQHLPSLIYQNSEASRYSSVSKCQKSDTSPDACTNEEIDHSDVQCKDQHLLNYSVPVNSAEHSAVNVSTDYTSKTDPTKEVKPRLRCSRRTTLEKSETQPVKNAPNKKTLEENIPVVADSRDNVKTDKRKTCHKAKEVAEPSLRCFTRSFSKRRDCREAKKIVKPSLKCSTGSLQPRIILERIEIQSAKDTPNEKTQPAQKTSNQKTQLAKNAPNNKSVPENTSDDFKTIKRKDCCETKEFVKISPKRSRLHILSRIFLENRKIQPVEISPNMKTLEENTSYPLNSSTNTEHETQPAEISPKKKTLEENTPNLANSATENREKQLTQISPVNIFVENSDTKTDTKSSGRKSKRLTNRNIPVMYESDDKSVDDSGDEYVCESNISSSNSESEEVQEKESKSKHKKNSSVNFKMAKPSTKNILHQCQICDDTFKNIDQLRYHVVKHLNTSSTMDKTGMDYSCSICQRVLSSVKSLNEHLQMHDSDVLKLTKVQSAEKLECKICFLTFYGNVTLNAHQKVHVFSKSNPPSIENFRKNTLCYFCGKDTRDISKLKIHLRIHTGEKPHKCTHCEKTFACQSSLTQHKTIHKETKDHICEVCGKAFRLAAKLNRHRKIHSKNIFNMLPCLYCDKKFSRRNNIREHEKIVHFKIYDENNAKMQCPDCHKFIVKRAFKEHCQIHLNRERTFHCEMCSKSFLTRKVLMKHVKSHASESKYICEYCGKGYQDKSCFMKHTWDHSKTDSFSCECGREFMTEDLLNAHKLKYPFKHVRVMRSKTEKVYTKNNYSKEELLAMNKKECPICYKLVAPGYLSEHKKIHKERKRQFQCSVCLVKFISKKTLIRHCKVHSSVKPFECTYKKCQRTFLNQNLFDQHLEGHRESVRKFADLREQHTQDGMTDDTDFNLNGDAENEVVREDDSSESSRGECIEKMIRDLEDVEEDEDIGSN